MLTFVKILTATLVVVAIIPDSRAKVTDFLVSQFNAYDHCNGKETGISKYVEGRSGEFLHCVAVGALKSRHCQFRCGAEQIGLVSKEGAANKTQVTELFKHFDEFPEKQEFMDAFIGCHNKADSYTTDNNCKSTRNLYYCASRKFNSICKIDKVIEESKEETGAISGALGTVTGVLGG